MYIIYIPIIFLFILFFTMLQERIKRNRNNKQGDGEGIHDYRKASMSEIDENL